MTKRYFYTCRIKAAFMAMYHDMVFTSPRRSVLHWDGGSDFRVTGAAGVYAGDNYYIHIDSIPLLEPQEGDIDADGFTYHAKLTWWLKSGIDQRGKLQVINNGSQHDKIIQRNGKAFFWPEVEEV